MNKHKLNNFVKGWFVGNFEPSIFKTNNFEVGCKEYIAGEKEQKHYHAIATEITLVVSGKIKMNDIEYVNGDIIVVEPNESISFSAIDDSVTVVIKVPCSKGDKYII